jgi:hypothetical protein
MRANPSALAGLALVFVVLTPAAAAAGEPPLPPPRPPEFSSPQKAPEAPQAPVPSPAPVQSPAPALAAGEGAASTCLAKLAAGGVGAEAAPAPATPVQGCGIGAPVRLSSITVAGGGVVSLPDRPLLECEFAAVLADYVSLIVAPLGQAMLHAKVAAIGTGPGYGCRTRDRIAGAKISAHGHGKAVDFMTIAFADKRQVLVERQAGPDEAAYFRAVRTAACGWFTTVLGPGSDAFHATNMHLDIEPHGSSGSYRICQ